MTKVRRLIFAGLATGSLMLIPSLASADCTTEQQGVAFVEEASGTTFVGTLTDATAIPDDPHLAERLTIEVETQYAGHVADPLTVDVDRCHGIVNIEPGRRILLTTADIDLPLAGNTLVWYADGNDLDLIGFDQRPPDEYVPAIRAIDTVQEALDALGIDELPDTSTVASAGQTGPSSESLPGSEWLLVLGGAAIAGTAAFTWRRREGAR